VSCETAGVSSLLDLSSWRQHTKRCTVFASCIDERGQLLSLSLRRRNVRICHGSRCGLQIIHACRPRPTSPSSEQRTGSRAALRPRRPLHRAVAVRSRAACHTLSSTPRPPPACRAAPVTLQPHARESTPRAGYPSARPLTCRLGVSLSAMRPPTAPATTRLQRCDHRRSGWQGGATFGATGVTHAPQIKVAFSLSLSLVSLPGACRCRRESPCSQRASSRLTPVGRPSPHLSSRTGSASLAAVAQSHQPQRRRCA
jgi:hypothetical protein